MLLTHKIEIRPTKEQEERLLQWVGCARHCYNTLLAHFSQNNVKFNKKSARVFYYKTIRVENEWHNNTSQNLQQSVINDLECSYNRFFRLVAGYPKYHKRGVKDSFSIRDKTKFKIEGNDLRIEKFNKGRSSAPLKLREKVRFSGILKQITISTKAGKWFASILVEVESGYNLKQPNKDTEVGIDLGIKTLVTTSDGQYIGKSNKLNKQLNKLAKLQQRMSKQKKGSNRRAKTKQKIQKLYYHVDCQKKALLHKVSDYLTANYRVICLEDLDVKGMLEKSNKNLSRMIADVGFYELRRQLEYKSFLRGGTVELVDRYFPSSKTCSSCGSIKEDLKLSDRTYKCDCGLEIDRDLNAALNILVEGLKQV